METKEILTGFEEYQTAQGAKYFHSQLVPEFDEDGNVQTVLAIGRDISELKQQQIEIKQINESLTKINKDLEQRNQEIIALSQVARSDLQEPLKRVYTSIEMIMSSDAQKLSSNGKAHLRRMQSALQRMRLITDDLLSYTSLTEKRNENFTEVNLNDVLNSATSGISKIIQGKNAKITAEQLLSLRGEYALLVQLFENIIHNTIKFQPKSQAPELIIYCEVMEDMLPRSLHPAST